MRDSYCASERAWASKTRLLLAAILLAWMPTAFAQLNGQNMRGDTGVGAGSLPKPGWSVNAFYSFYDVTDLRDADGDEIIRGTEIENETAALICPTSPILPSAIQLRKALVRSWCNQPVASSHRTLCSRQFASICSASVAFIASGFSHSTCLPALAEAIAHSACIDGGSEM